MLNVIYLDYNDLRAIPRSFRMLKELRLLYIGHIIIIIYYTILLAFAFCVFC